MGKGILLFFPIRIRFKYLVSYTFNWGKKKGKSLYLIQQKWDFFHILEFI